jgi:DNA-binding response OmpR family regulator
MGNQKKILIVDDERDFCKLVLLMFEHEPFHIECANNLKEAADQLKREHPDIVLLDNNLPDGVGLEFLVQGKAEFADSKIILITADASPEMKQRALDVGVHYLAKPFSLKRIREIVCS